MPCGWRAAPWKTEVTPAVALAERAPGARRAALLAAHGLFWLGLMALITRTPPIDNVEQLVWRHAPAWGYYKHPPLPTWLLGAAAALWPPTPALTYLLGALCLLGALALYGLLLRRLLGADAARLALLAMLCLSYATDRLPFYNHNVVMLPLIAGVALLLWRATERPALAPWAGIGLLLGLGLLAKYQMALAAACVALWWLRIGGWRQPVQRAGLLLAALLAALVFAPHLAWLVRADFAPLRYAEESALGAHVPLLQRPAQVALWTLDWLGNRLLPAWLLLGAAWLLARRRAGAPAAAPPPAALARDYLLLWGFGPLVLMALMALLGGIHLQLKWSTAFAPWTVAALVALGARRPARGQRLGAARVAWPAFVLVQALLVAQVLWWAQGAQRDPTRSGGWRQRDFASAAEALAGPARQALGGPVQLINGPYGVAGALALRLPGQPRVLIDGELAKSPWLTPERLAGARTLSVWPACALPEGAHRLMPGWAWWPRAAPPPAAGAREQALRDDASRDGGALNVTCP